MDTRPEVAERIATIHAVFRGSDKIEIADLEWSIALTRHSTAQLARGLQAHMLEEYEEADLVEHIREQFKNAPLKTGVRILTEGQIRKHCERKTKDLKKIGNAIYHLLTCEDISELEQPYAAGRPTRRFRWKGK